MVSTSRKPSRRTRTFCKDLTRSLPNSFYQNRGKLSLDGLLETARFKGYQRVIVIHEQFGNPMELVVFALTEDNWERVVELVFKGVSLTRELIEEKVSTATDLSLDAEKDLEQLSLQFVDKDMFIKGSERVMRVRQRTDLIELNFLEQGQVVGPKIMIKKVEQHA